MAPCCNESSPTTSCQGVYPCCVPPILCRGEVSCVQQYFGMPPSSCQNMVRVTCMPAFAERGEAVMSVSTGMFPMLLPVFDVFCSRIHL